MHRKPELVGKRLRSKLHWNEYLPCSVGNICLFSKGLCTTCEPCAIIPTKGTGTKTCDVFENNKIEIMMQIYEHIS